MDDMTSVDTQYSEDANMSKFQIFITQIVMNYSSVSKDYFTLEAFSVQSVIFFLNLSDNSHN